ncbi:MAG: hypothetical protein P8Z37_01505 [Acidobacteriota bacterium]
MKEASGLKQVGKERRWECDWEEHGAHQRQCMAHLTLAEELLWLEQAQRMVHYLQTSQSALTNPKDTCED